MRRRSGFTLMELMAVMIIIGILVAIAVPGFGRTTESAHQRQARDMLQTIYAGEQVYFSVNDAFSDVWADIYMDDPNSATTTYTVTVGGGAPPTFMATATRVGGTCDLAVMTIDEARTLGGSWLTCPMPL